MSTGCDKRLRRIFVDSLERSVTFVLFEKEDSIAENPELGRSVTYLVCYGSQIFPDNDVSASNAFERKYTHKVRSVFADIDPVGCTKSFRNREQPKQPHDMVDAKCTARPDDLPDTFPEKLVPTFAMSSGVRWWKRPILAIWRKVIWGGTNPATVD